MLKYYSILITSIIILLPSCNNSKKLEKKERKIDTTITIEKDYKPDYKNIFEAVDKEDFKAVKYFIENQGVFVNVINDNKQRKTILMEAAKIGNAEIITYLLEKGADIYLKDFQEKSVLQYAVLSKQLGTVKGFLKRGLEINHQDIFGNTAVIYATKANDLNMVKYLVQENANLNLKNKKGETAIFFATQNNNLEMVKLLNEYGLSLKSVNINNENLFFYASGETVASYLYRKGIDINLLNTHNQTALFRYIDNNNLKMVGFFYRKSGDVNIEDNNGDNSVIYATKKQKADIIDFLYRHNVNLNQVNSKGESVIHYAWNLGSIKFFYRHNVDITKQNLFGKDKLMMLAESGKLTIKTFKYFIQHHYDVNANDNDEMYIIHYIIKYGTIDMLKYLVQNHANLEIKIKNKNLLEYAKEQGKNSMYKYLKKYVKTDLY